jgi:hypothetical protein
VATGSLFVSGKLNLEESSIIYTFEELGPGGGEGGDNTMKNLSTLRQKTVTTMQNKELQALSDKKGDNNAK